LLSHHCPLATTGTTPSAADLFLLKEQFQSPHLSATASY
jgi:hypothetical protein